LPAGRVRIFVAAKGRVMVFCLFATLNLTLELGNRAAIRILAALSHLELR
jgi:hypothetical protein